MLPYPFLAILAGLAFFIMGSNYWGRCYAIGAAFFALACAMPFVLEWAPLLFGLFWSAALTMVGIHLRGFAKQDATLTDSSEKGQATVLHKE